MTTSSPPVQRKYSFKRQLLTAILTTAVFFATALYERKQQDKLTIKSDELAHVARELRELEQKRAQRLPSKIIELGAQVRSE
jgi:hypothetical protein